MTDVWINGGSGCFVESIESQYINIQLIDHYKDRPYVDLPIESKYPRKGLINIYNKDRKVLYVNMLDILILQKNTQEEQKKLTKNVLKNLIMMELSFL